VYLVFLEGGHNHFVQNLGRVYLIDLSSASHRVVVDVGTVSIVVDRRRSIDRRRCRRRHHRIRRRRHRRIVVRGGGNGYGYGYGYSYGYGHGGGFGYADATPTVSSTSSLLSSSPSSSSSSMSSASSCRLRRRQLLIDRAADECCSLADRDVVESLSRAYFAETHICRRRLQAETMERLAHLLLKTSCREALHVLMNDEQAFAAGCAEPLEQWEASARLPLS